MFAILQLCVCSEGGSKLKQQYPARWMKREQLAGGKMRHSLCEVNEGQKCGPKE